MTLRHEQGGYRIFLKFDRTEWKTQTGRGVFNREMAKKKQGGMTFRSRRPATIQLHAYEADAFKSIPFCV